jgi:predicted glycosyltransferase
MRDRVPKHFEFAGYILDQHPRAFGPRGDLRERLGYRPGERICIATVGGSGVGVHLMRRIAHRLDRYGAGRRMAFETSTPRSIADAIIITLRTPVRYQPVEADGAARAAGMIVELL